MPTLRDREFETLALLRTALAERRFGNVAAVSSFGAESAVLLHLVAQIDAATPVLFVDTRMLFQETLDYRDTLVAHLGLKDVRTVSATPRTLADTDPWGRMHLSAPDACCALRKVTPLNEALAGFDGWITGRKRFQSLVRGELPCVERDAGGKIKLNPLADWTSDDLSQYADAFDLPQHPLTGHGYASIGCAACTSAVKPGEDARAGRWRGLDKTECGIHFENGRLVRRHEASA